MSFKIVSLANLSHSYLTHNRNQSITLIIKIIVIHFKVVIKNILKMKLKYKKMLYIIISNSSRNHLNFYKQTKILKTFLLNKKIQITIHFKLIKHKIINNSLNKKMQMMQNKKKIIKIIIILNINLVKQKAGKIINRKKQISSIQKNKIIKNKHLIFRISSEKGKRKQKVLKAGLEQEQEQNKNKKK